MILFVDFKSGVVAISDVAKEQDIRSMTIWGNLEAKAIFTRTLDVISIEFRQTIEPFSHPMPINISDDDLPF